MDGDTELWMETLNYGWRCSAHFSQWCPS